MFDNGMKSLTIPDDSERQSVLDKIFEEAKKLLEKTLAEFDKINKELYA